MTFLLAEPKRIGFRALGTQTPGIPRESWLFKAGSAARLRSQGTPPAGLHLGWVGEYPCKTVPPLVQLSFKNW